jgi:hypothetical protein
MTRKIFAVLGFLALALSGCATAFTGESHVPGGPAGCEAKCKSWGLEFVGMVAMGEYSDACVCHRPGAQASLVDEAGAVAGGTAGVIVQTQRAQQQAAHH